MELRNPGEGIPGWKWPISSPRCQLLGRATAHLLSPSAEKSFSSKLVHRLLKSDREIDKFTFRQNESGSLVNFDLLIPQCGFLLPHLSDH